MAVCEAEGVVRATHTLEAKATPAAHHFTQRERTDIMGIMVDRTTGPQVLEDIDRFVQSQTPHQIVTVNVDFLNIAKKDPGFVDLLNGAAISVPDGMPLLWVSKVLGTPLPERITGTDLLLGCADMAAKKGYRIFLLGAAEGVAAETGKILEQRYPGLKIVGAYSPPYSVDPAEDERTIKIVTDAKPDMLFVALGTPKQEKWIFANLHKLNVPVCIGVGGVFNFLSGRVPRAPQAMQSLGMEWLFRLCCEPRRLWRRYLVEDSRAFSSALAYTARRRLKLNRKPAQREYDPSRTQPVPLVSMQVTATAAGFVGDNDWTMTNIESARAVATQD